MRNLAPKNLRQDRALVIFKCLIFRKIYPPKKGSETSNERKNTVFSPTSLHMPKKKLPILCDLFCDGESGDPFKGWNCENSQRFGIKFGSPHLNFLSWRKVCSMAGPDSYGTSPVGVFTIKIQNLCG